MCLYRKRAQISSVTQKKQRERERERFKREKDAQNLKCGVYESEKALVLYRRKYNSKSKMIHGFFNAYNRLCISHNQLCSSNLEEKNWVVTNQF